MKNLSKYQKYINVHMSFEDWRILALSSIDDKREIEKRYLKLVEDYHTLQSLYIGLLSSEGRGINGGF